MKNNIWMYFKIELTLLWRRSQSWLYPLCFFAIVISLFPLSFTPDPHFIQRYLPSCIWLSAFLTSLITVENFFVPETEDGYLEQLLLSDMPLNLIVFLKIIAQWLIAELPLIIFAGLFSVLANLAWQVTGALIVSLIIGTPALVTIGAFISALTLGLRQQGALLGLLILPLSIPLLIFGISIIQLTALDASILRPLALLASFSLITLVCLPWAIASALALSLED